MHISTFISSFLIVFINEEKLVALLVYLSFRWVAPCMLRTVFVIANSGNQVSQGWAQMKSEYGFTTYSVKHYGTA